MENKYWSIDEIAFFIAMAESGKHDNRYTAFTLWFTRDGEVIERHYETMKGSKIAAKNRYRGSCERDVETVVSAPFIG